MQIRTDDRVFICAKTGAGKTTYAKRFLLSGYPRIVFWDIKHQNGDWPHTFLARNPAGIGEGIVQKHSHILYQPDDISPDDFNKVCQIVYNCGNVAIYIDEVAFVTTGNHIEYYHKLLLVMGRSRGCGVITATQRPVNVANYCISEAEHFFIGKLQLEDDVKKIGSVLPKEYKDIPPKLEYYHWIYTDTEMVIFIEPQPI